MSDEQQGKDAPLKVTSQHAHRALALQMLYALDRSDDLYASPDELLQLFVQNYDLSLDSQAFAMRLVHGVVDNDVALTAKITELAKKWPLERIGCLTRIVLKIALFEITEQLTPAQVAIDQAVELAKDFCEKDAYRFINGILDSFFKASNKKNQE